MLNEINLTRRQQEIYDFLVHQQDYSYRPPSLEELCQALNMKSRGSLHKHIQALIDAGLVEPINRKQRGIRLTPKQPDESQNLLPFVGTIAAGRPIEALETAETMEVPELIQSAGECFVLKVKGDSMIEEGILNDDWVIIRKQSYAKNGEIVVALIDNLEASLKRIEQKPEDTILHPANSSMEPMHYHPNQIQIQGILVGQMRSYQ
ncbi:MAG: transcriptional repressor LexA [Methylococcales bacterium]